MIVFYYLANGIDPDFISSSRYLLSASLHLLINIGVDILDILDLSLKNSTDSLDISI
jgi:hypothetical protein